MLRPIAAVAALILAFAAGTVAGRGAMTDRATPDGVLASGFGHALADTDTSWTSMPRNIWLSSLGANTVSGARNLAIGDHITIASGSAKARQVEVVALEHIDGAAIGRDTLRLQLVTAREAANPAAPPLRFMFVLDPPGEQRAFPAGQPTSGRVL